MNNDYLAENTSTLEVDTDQLKQVSQLVTKIQEEQKEVAALEAQLKTRKAALAKLVEMDLPSLMIDEIKLASITTLNGAEVSIKDTLYASIPKKNKRIVAEWLMTHGHGSLVSESIVATFGKGEGERVQEVVQLLAENGIGNMKVEEAMNTTSIKALIRELTSSGVEVPLEMFGAHWVRQAVIK